MLRDPDRQVMEKAYARWAPVYDVLCGPVFLNGRRAAARAARDVGGRILEIGVGTGLSFDDYDATTEITGIDISEPMIARARERRKNGRYPFVKELTVMDAHALTLCRTPHSIASSANSSSRWSRIRSACCRNARGCCGPAAKSFWSIISTPSAALRPRSSACWHRRRASSGLRPEFPFQRLAAWAQAHGGAELIERRKVKPFGVYTLVRFRRAEANSAAA